MRFYSSLAFLLFLCSCKEQKDFAGYNITKSVIADSAMVVSAHPVATQIGVEILKQGGNAVDAAIAVQFALAVCYPEAGNIGGGGFMLYRDAYGQVSALDYREMAPSLSQKDMFLDSLGNVVKNLSLNSHLASGVPGSVAGMYEAFLKFSQLKDWKKLVQPSINIARNGVYLTAKEAEVMNEATVIFNEVNKGETVFTKQKWKEGDLFIQPDLANTLTIIRDQGKDGFYKGKVADLIVAEMKNGNGIISHHDLTNYKAVWRTPLSFTYRGNKIISMPPPSSGGILLNQLLKSIEPYDVGTMGFHSTATVHLMVESERRAYADRATHLGDSDFYNVPVTTITDSIYIQNRMKDFDLQKASLSTDITAGKIQKESEQTTHISIVDQFGNAVAVTTTLNNSFGSQVVVKGAGFILNNEMDDFSIKPGHANYYGLVGSEANKIESGKRMLSSMTPTIVEQQGKLKMVVGTPGGSTIITSVFQTIVNVLDFKMTAFEAIAAPRFHHQWLPDTIAIEANAIKPDVVSALNTMGHKFKTRSPIGKVEAIVVRPDGKLDGGADVRRDDDAKGF